MEGGSFWELGYHPQVSLSASDEHHIQAAEGWLELDHAVEANEELEQIAPENRSHPVLLFLRCRIYLGTHRAEYAHTVAAILTERFPERPEGWFYLACACSRIGRQDEARDALKKCFVAAAKTGQEKKWQEKALDCRDLAGMWIEEQSG